MATQVDFDYIIVGSGFGGSVAALRLAEKGYRVLVLEKGKWLSANEFPKSNWNLKRWLWLPALRCFGLFKITFFRHVGITSGVGVGGGSLVYANTLPVPKATFFQAPSWAHLADWESELREDYAVAARMLGATRNPRLEVGDLALKQLAAEIGREAYFGPNRVGVFFGEPEVTVPDPYFDGRGPPRAGCNFCGGCMVGCRFNAKNSLDKNYLHLAQAEGARIQAESEVSDVQPLTRPDGTDGYRVRWRSSTTWRKRRGAFTCHGVVFAGGVLGTVKLLLALKRTSLPRLSDRVGCGVRTNSESLIGVTTLERNRVFSDGLAIGSILHADEHSHLEPVRYPAGSGFWGVMTGPMVSGDTFLIRLVRFIAVWLRHPHQQLRLALVRDWAKQTQILLFMQTLDSTLRFSQGWWRMKTNVETGRRPTPFIAEARQLADHYGRIVNGEPTVLLNESLLGIPTTAHILGGAVMGRNRQEGVIDHRNRVFGYHNMLICDGSTISANPGVNPSLTITALSERAMRFIPPAAETTWAATPAMPSGA